VLILIKENHILQNFYLRHVAAEVFQIACSAICNIWLEHIIFVLWIHDHLVQTHVATTVKNFLQNYNELGTGKQDFQDDILAYLDALLT
jgi:hypothetical protein